MIKNFKNIEHWIFDLDNTLYEPECDLFSQIDKKMGEYLASYFGVGLIEAKKKQKQLFEKYGTTLCGLIEEENIDADDYLKKVHDIDYGVLKPNKKLDEVLKKLPGKKHIFTNADRLHAERVLDRLQIKENFEIIFDIVSAKMQPKPKEETYKKFIEQTKTNPKKSIFFEDMPQNLEVPKKLGMQTVLIVPNGETAATAEFQPDFITDDIAGFLQGVVEGLNL